MIETTPGKSTLPNSVITDVPKSVKNACGLVVGALIVDLCTLPSIIYSTSTNDLHGKLVFAAIVSLIYCTLTGFLVFKIRRRKNWARWTNALLTAVGVMMSLDSFTEDWALYPLVALLGCISAAMGVGAVWLLFNFQSNSWYMRPSEGGAKTNTGTYLSDPDRSWFNKFAYTCPSCEGIIPFLSKTVHSWGKVKRCPHCSQSIAPKLAYGKFFVLAFSLGLPIKMLGVFVPAFAFLNGSIVTGLVMGICIFLCFRFELVPDNAQP